MDFIELNIFVVYGKVVGQWVYGVFWVACYGVVGVLVCFLIICLDDILYIGFMAYDDQVDFILAIVISINDVELFSCLLREEFVCVYMCNNSCMFSEAFFYNVIGEICGLEYLEEIIFVGGYLDFWDVGIGVYDDGVGCVYVMEVLC